MRSNKVTQVWLRAYVPLAFLALSGGFGKDPRVSPSAHAPSARRHCVTARAFRQYKAENLLFAFPSVRLFEEIDGAREHEEAVRVRAVSRLDQGARGPLRLGQRLLPPLG